jgi:hypothetical protein
MQLVVSRIRKSGRRMEKYLFNPNEMYANEFSRFSYNHEIDQGATHIESRSIARHRMPWK